MTLSFGPAPRIIFQAGRTLPHPWGTLVRSCGLGISDRRPYTRFATASRPGHDVPVDFATDLTARSRWCMRTTLSTHFIVFLGRGSIDGANGEGTATMVAFQGEARRTAMQRGGELNGVTLASLCKLLWRCCVAVERCLKSACTVGPLPHLRGTLVYL